MGKDFATRTIKRSPQYRSYGECAITCLLRKNYPHLKIETCNRTELNGYEIDIWIPTLNTGIEYNGQHHFKPVYGQTIFERTQLADKTKKEIADNKGIKLIYIVPTGSVAKDHKTKLKQLFLECCNKLGVPSPIIHTVSSSEVEYEQKHNKPSHQKYINLGRKWSPEQKKKASAKLSRSWTLKSPNGETLMVNNLQEFCKTQNIQYTWMISQFKQNKSCKGWSKISMD